ncbi:ABC transporter substrate-binding protein [Kutzneria kofuensis]|uniref:Cellobiose transport system substrate-binding protein n=1 Tax=Kutzneria kofuensis TaxID=103725 RepID=A0A7W9KQI1_9PSEU|nr:extracellular solute-binding protein [Kutzneria kofuensis]MBB5896895.1 cellobiose transport system substrate-binding protein [Kutzneria kofuensis]
MELSRRRFLQASALTAAAAGFTAACGSSGSTSAHGKDLTLWYWGGGLSDKVVGDAKTHFAADITLTASSIGGDFKQKLVTTLAAGGSSVPDITGIKGEDMASFIPSASKFLDLNELGFKDIASQYLAWKTKRAQTPDGKQLGFPIDIGPTGMYYRVDLFEQAGLPTDPAQVAAQVKTWDDFWAAGAQLHRAVPKSFPVRNLPELFSIVINQGTKRFVDENNHFIGDQDHIRNAWNTAVKSQTSGLNGKVDDNSWNAAIATGTLGVELGAAWHALDIEQAAPDLKGKWRVAPMPGGPANDGGSFLALPRQCRNPEQAFKIISWILDPENDARGFTDAALFPAAPAAYKLPAMTTGDPYFGGQKTIDVFGPAAEAIPISYEAPADAAVMAPYRTELGNIENNGKSPDAAWNDAVSQAKQIAQRQGVS